MDLLSDLNEPQRRAVTHMDGPLLVLAGAGSGKTRVITRRVAHLISRGVAPWQVLAITFTNKAAREMSERIRALGTPRGGTACTFHGLCARLLREFATEAGLSADYSIYDAADQKRVAKAAVEKADLASGMFAPARVLAAIGRAKTRLQMAEAFAAGASCFADQQMAKVYRLYEQMLSAANALDFDDLLMRMAFLLRDRPDVRRGLSERYRYILIDEYQDTNHAQYIIAHGIALDHENICATGDPDQSIYSWRGADIGNILEFESDYANAQVIRLVENYRSTGSILAAADRLISYNRNRRAKTLFTRRPKGDDLIVVTTTDEHAESAEVIRRVRDLIARGRGHDDIAVFYRLNSLSRVLEEAFRKNGVPYRIARGVEFYNRKEIKDVLAYAKLLSNPRDDVACERIINVPPRGIGAKTIRRLRRFAEEARVGLFVAAQQATDIPALGKAAAARVAKFAALIGALKPLTDGPVKDLMEAVLNKTALETHFKAVSGEDRTELTNVEELVTSAAEFDSEGENTTLADYLNLVTLVSDADRFEGGTGAVTLMTLHAAKGLEFPAVIIVGCEEGILPFYRAGTSDEQSEEERRLCFVGMTRAQDELILTRADYRGLRGVRQRQAPSKFLLELNGRHVTHVDLSDHIAPDVQTAPAAASQGNRFQRRRTREIQPNYDDGFFDPEVADEEACDLQGDAGGMRRGSRVRHQKFGAGRVAKIGRSGSYISAVVDFERFGRKTLVLKYARLELLR